MADNGNGSRPLEIDVTDEHAFRTGVVQHLQFIVDKTSVIPELKKKVDEHEKLISKHENIVKFGMWAAPTSIAAIGTGLKFLFKKLGW